MEGGDGKVEVLKSVLLLKPHAVRRPLELEQTPTLRQPSLFKAKMRYGLGALWCDEP